MTYLPHRHTDKSVRRFVPVLETLLSNHKTFGEFPVSFDPNTLGISTETGLARLRDAVHSIVNGLTIYPTISSSELGSVWPRYQVVSEGNNIVIKPKHSTINAAQPHVGAKLGTLDVEQPAFSELLTAFALLLGNHILQGEVTINGELNPVLQQQLEATYDIVISQTGPNQHTML